MCTVVLLLRPEHDWPLILGANRDERRDRPWRPPGRHWPEQPGVVAGLDELAGGSWLGMNDAGVVAAVMNRAGTLGPAPHRRSRGELVLEALDHHAARDAVEVLSELDPAAYRSFNLVIADRHEVFWLRNPESAGGIDVMKLPPGLSMLTAYDLNDTRSARIRNYLPQFHNARPPDPAANDWAVWARLLGDRGGGNGDVEGAMNMATDAGIGTVSSALIALPAEARPDLKPVWRFAAGAPDRVPFEAVAL